MEQVPPPDDDLPIPLLPEEGGHEAAARDGGAAAGTPADGGSDEGQKGVSDGGLGFKDDGEVSAGDEVAGEETGGTVAPMSGGAADGVGGGDSPDGVGRAVGTGGGAGGLSLGGGPAGGELGRGSGVGGEVAGGGPAGGGMGGRGAVGRGGRRGRGRERYVRPGPLLEARAPAVHAPLPAFLVPKPGPGEGEDGGGEKAGSGGEDGGEAKDEFGMPVARKAPAVGGGSAGGGGPVLLASKVVGVTNAALRPRAKPRQMSGEELGALPRLPRFSSVYLGGLLVMVAGFYLLLLGSIAGVLALFAGLIWVGQWLVLHSPYQGGELIGLLVPVVLGLFWFLYALIRSMLVRVGSEPFGMECGRLEYEALYALTDAVALDCGAEVIENIYLTPGTEIAVTEDSTLWMPPGLGRRNLHLGMAMLDRLTLDQLRAVLAHEYGHFSSSDKFFSRFVGRVYMGFGGIVATMAMERWRDLNPVYWCLCGYFYLFSYVAAAHSRLREFYADRVAVRTYGKEMFEEALIGVHLEDSYYRKVWLKRLAQAAVDRRFGKNTYREIGAERMRIHADVGTEGLLGVLAEIFETKPSRFDAHPSLVRRLMMQGIDGGKSEVPSPTRVARGKGEAKLSVEERAALGAGPASAAEELFGGELGRVQEELSALLEEELRHKVRVARMVRNLVE